MKISVAWLRDWVDLDGSAQALADELTIAGLEVDDVDCPGAGIENVVVARVDQVEPHPQADRLRVCQAFDGEAVHEIVCGAPNVAAGLHVPLARVGARLPGGMKIKASKLRGVRSNGMLCSGKELGADDGVDGLLVLADDAEPGQSVVELLGLDDTVITVDLTPNRGDCFSMLGVAREVSARRGIPLRLPNCEPVTVDSDLRFHSRVSAEQACPRLCTRVVTGLDNKAPVPRWLSERLTRAGLRSISPVVDVTNYVMLELGQPLHAYDRDSLNEFIDVRMARPNEVLELLNESSIDLSDDVLVIADAERAIGLAGIMGGASTGVTDDTQDIVFEAAFFSPDAIAGRARRYGLHTDASVRFERGVDPEHQMRAIERATRLLIEIAGGTAGPVEICEAQKHLPLRSAITLNHQRLNDVLGIEVDAAQVNVMLTRLGMQIEEAASGWRVRPPGFRFDIDIEEDLIEEVGRMIGYDHIPAIPASHNTHIGTNTEHRLSPDTVVDAMVGLGYQEILTYSFIDPELASLVNPGAETLPLANPISAELAVMRRSLWPGLLSAAKRNIASQTSDLRLLEYGPQFTEKGAQANVFAGLASGNAFSPAWDTPARNVDFYDVKSDVEAMLGLAGRGDAFRFVAGEHPALHPGQTAKVVLENSVVGWIGVLHPSVQKELDLRTSCVLFSMRADAVLDANVPAYVEFSRLPSIRRDIALVVDEKITAIELIDSVRRHAGTLLRDVIVFDVYRGKGIDATGKSIGLGLILQDASRTLTDADADDVVSTVTQRLQRDLGATIRT